MTFWDGVLISSLIWYIVAGTTLLLGFAAGARSDSGDWGAGYDAGWEAAIKTYLPEILEKEEGMNV